MAGSLGSLVVSLGLDAVEFTTGLTKSEYQARKFAQQLDKAIATGARAAGAAILTMGAAAVGAFAAINELAQAAGNFKDLEETTGANAESLAAFAVAAGTAGVSIETIAGSMNKMTKGLVSVEDETKDAGAALKALGLNVEQFKQLDPATQMEEVARALAGFEDGAAKTAVAMALFGKSGAALLPFLKELAAEGGRQVILTQAQIERADAYADAQARARTQLQLYLQALATEALPTITAVISAMRTFVATIVGVSTETKKLDGEDIRRFAEVVVLSVTKAIDVADAFSRQFILIGKAVGAGMAIIAAAAGGEFTRAKAIINEFVAERDAIIAKPTASQIMAKQFAEDARLRKLAAQEDRGFKPPGRQLSFTGKVDAGKAQKEQTSEAERYLQTLEKQIQSTQELSAVEVARMEIAKGMKGLTPDLERQIMLYAEMVDFLRNVKKEEEERKRIEQEAGQARQRNEAALAKAVDESFREADAIRQGNQQIEDQITLLVKGEAALNKVNEARLDSLILQAKDKLFAEQNAAGYTLQAQALEQMVAALERRKQLFAETEIAKRIKEEADKLQDLKNNMSDALVQPLVDFINQTKSAKDAFKDFLSNIQQMLAQKAARTVADYLFGGQTGSGFDFGTIFKWISGMLGGGTGFLPPGAAGPPMLATGTSYAQGGMALVGESGPELVRLPVGARVSSASDTRRSGGSMSITINPPAGMSRQSSQQFAVQVGSEISRRMKRA